MAARLNPRHQQSVRDKIRASQLVNRLENHVLDDLELTSTQVSSALGLLRKCIPDLQSTELKGDGEGLTINLVSQVADKPADDNP